LPAATPAKRLLLTSRLSKYGYLISPSTSFYKSTAHKLTPAMLIIYINGGWLKNA